METRALEVITAPFFAAIDFVLDLPSLAVALVSALAIAAAVVAMATPLLG